MSQNFGDQTVASRKKREEKQNADPHRVKLQFIRNLREKFFKTKFSLTKTSGS